MVDLQLFTCFGLHLIVIQVLPNYRNSDPFAHELPGEIWNRAWATFFNGCHVTVNILKSRQKCCVTITQPETEKKRVALELETVINIFSHFNKLPFCITQRLRGVFFRLEILILVIRLRPTICFHFIKI